MLHGNLQFCARVFSELLQLGCGRGTDALIVKFLACGLEQAQEDILVLATLKLLRLQLSPHLSDHVFEHIDNFLFGIGARLSFSFDLLSDPVLLFRDFGLHLEVSLFSLQDLQLYLVVELREVVFETRFEILKCVISCL